MSKRDLRLPALLIFGIYALYSCAIMPLNNYIFSDWVLQTSLWADAIDVVAHLVETLGFAAIVGFTVHTVYRYGKAGYRPMLILFACALLFKYVAAVYLVGLAGGMFYFPEDLYAILISLGIEIAQLVFALLLGHRLIGGAKEQNSRIERAKRHAKSKHTEDAAEPVALYPFTRPFSRKNPLQRTVFWSTIAALGLQTVTYVIEEISYSMMGAFFSPADLPIVLLYWAILILIPCVGGYFLAQGCIMLRERLLARRSPTEEDNEEETEELSEKAAKDAVGNTDADKKA